MDSSTNPCFLQDNDDTDDSLAGISGHHHFLSHRTRTSSRPSRFHDDPLLHPHFLDSCFLCRTPLGDNSDIFMYRGDTPFCSEECRHEQIEIDEAKEKKLRRSSSAAMTKKEQQRRRSSASPIKSSPPSSDYPYRSGTVAAA